MPRRRGKPGPPPLPRSFVVGATRWKLTNNDAGWGRALELSVRDPNIIEVNGLTIPAQLMVALRPDLPRHFERRVLMHELVHVAVAASGWQEAFVLVNFAEEAIAHAVEGPLLEVLSRNAGLRAYLFD